MFSCLNVNVLQKENKTQARVKENSARGSDPIERRLRQIQRRNSGFGLQCGYWPGI